MCLLGYLETELSIAFMVEEGEVSLFESVETLNAFRGLLTGYGEVLNGTRDFYEIERVVVAIRAIDHLLKNAELKRSLSGTNHKDTDVWV